MRIAVSGIGITSALGIGVASNLKAIREGRSGIIPHSRLTQTRHELPVGELEFDNAALKRLLGIAPQARISRTALLGALAAKEALADAGIVDTSRVGIVSATSVGGMDLTENFFPDYIDDPQKADTRLAKMHDCASSTRFIAYICGIGGWSSTISTACSSAANAIMMGAKLIEHGLLDTVVVGGTDALSRFTINGFKSLMILDSAACRPFDQSRAGLNLGEGAGYLVLQSEEALGRLPGKTPYCYLGGFANTNDAHHQTASSADGEGAYLAMTQALKSAGIDPTDVDYINVHGTGTGNNDLSEGTALKRIWGESVPAFSSTKGFTGHTLAAAGGIEAVFSVLSIAKGIIWPNLRFCNAIDGLELVPQTIMKEGAKIRCVVSNSLGFGGNCSSLVFCDSKDASNGAYVQMKQLKDCWIEAVVQDCDVCEDVKELIPDAGLRRRMSKVIKNAVSTASKCVGGPDGTAEVDAIITATGLGCLADSEKFLLNIIRDREDLLNPTPFIQSTFNTVGGQIALLSHNHCYNMTYVNRSRSFADALTDAVMRLSDGASKLALVGAFDENTASSTDIMERLGLQSEQDGSVFVLLSSERTPRSIGRLIPKGLRDAMSSERANADSGKVEGQSSETVSGKVEGHRPETDSGKEKRQENIVLAVETARKMAVAAHSRQECSIGGMKIEWIG